VDDARNSPAKRVIELLLRRGAVVTYHDPYVPRFRVGDDVFHREPVLLESVLLTDEALSVADCVVIVTGHRSLDYTRVVDRAARVVDTCNATADAGGRTGQIIRLGVGGPGFIDE
jgi:UDP-N-acetyl-D-glucosamine dehydrogenase